jgi:hypothetical protein
MTTSATSPNVKNQNLREILEKLSKGPTTIDRTDSKSTKEISQTEGRMFTTTPLRIIKTDPEFFARGAVHLFMEQLEKVHYEDLSTTEKEDMAYYWRNLERPGQSTTLSNEEVVNDLHKKFVLMPALTAAQCVVRQFPVRFMKLNPNSLTWVPKLNLSTAVGGHSIPDHTIVIDKNKWVDGNGNGDPILQSQILQSQVHLDYVPFITVEDKMNSVMQTAWDEIKALFDKAFPYQQIIVRIGSKGEKIMAQVLSCLYCYLKSVNFYRSGHSS